MSHPEFISFVLKSSTKVLKCLSVSFIKLCVMAGQTEGTQMQRPVTELRGEKEFIVNLSQRGRKAGARLRIARISRRTVQGSAGPAGG